ncbi:putative effector protein [Aphelenchoides fujianensis]|nr:putative effector protein [Aphelenchoides fujianensis]
MGGLELVSGGWTARRPLVSRRPQVAGGRRSFATGEKKAERSFDFSPRRVPPPSSQRPPSAVDECGLQPSAQPAEKTPSVDPNHFQPATSPCYDRNNDPQRCVPDFVNAAFNRYIEVTNTCGERRPTNFCVQTGHMGIRKVCDECDARIPEKSHHASFLTDFNNPENETWWQSDTMADGVQYPMTVNITLHLGKAFDITYLRLRFVSPRPESFIIYKKTRLDGEWEPWQYYSGSCRSTFKMAEKQPILPGHEDVAQCTREYSDISPITGGTIAFSTLEGRPSAENFEESEVLQEWVTASAIRIVLVRMNTYGDEIFRDPRVLRSYYYAISDLAAGGRCKCNGHASECVQSTGEGTQQLVCGCKHHTAGVDCEKCEPFYQDRPWRAATSSEANECLPCNCSGLSNRCFFDEKLFEETGHGGHCIDCTGHTEGPHCERCSPNHWRRPREHYCTACQCNEVGSESQQCDENGQCKCKPGVTGQFCDQCENGFYDFGPNGCKDCHCEVAGSANNQPQCSPTDGTCSCKVNVEGRQCDKCKPGYFNLALGNAFGCSPCFCFGHSSVCSSADGFYAYNESSLFNQGECSPTLCSHARRLQTWSSGRAARTRSRRTSSGRSWTRRWPPRRSTSTPSTFSHPRSSSAINDMPTTRTSRLRSACNKPSRRARAFGSFISICCSFIHDRCRDVILVGVNGQELTLSITAQNNPLPSSTEHTYRYKVHANSALQWNPRLREIDFIGILSNLTAIKIRGTYANGGPFCSTRSLPLDLRLDVGFLSNFTLGSAGLVVPEGAETQPAEWVESCQCGEEYVGQFCESCASGYKRNFPFGGPLAKCVPCQCNGHSDSCDPESGACICQDNTAGDQCEHCARGYYGDALSGTADGCKKCDCPENGPCVLMNDGDTICTECPEGYTGRKCDACADEYYGDPANGVECKKCDCNGNTDPNSIGNCDSTSGECRRCVYHTTGFNCERCEAGFWGDALSEPKGDCKPCNCYAPGTRRPTADYERLECRQEDGQCDCLPNVIGQFCDRCEAGFFNLTSGSGCEACDCDPLGSLNTTCEVVSGQCACKPGVTGPALRSMCASSLRLLRRGLPALQLRSDGLRVGRCTENRYDLAARVFAVRRLLLAHRPPPDGDPRPDRQAAQRSGRYSEQSRQGGGQRVRRSRAGGAQDRRGAAREGEQQARHGRGESERSGERREAARPRRPLVRQEHVILRELESAIDRTRREGQTQLENAQNAATRFGDRSQQLSSLADEARRVVAGQEKQKADTEEAAERTANVSKKALEEATEAIYGASTTSQQIATLTEQLQKTSEALNVTRGLAEQESADADATHEKAVSALSSIESVKLPDVIPDELVDDAEHQKQESTLSLDNAREKINENAQQLEDARTALAEAENDLRQARAQQEQALATLRDVEAARNRSKDAFDLATKMWNDAQGSLNSLTDFNENIDASKEEAMRELEKLADIQQQIEEARATTAIAEADIGSAKLDAEHAQKMAEKALEDAKAIAAQAASLKEKTTTTSTDAETQKAELEKLIEAINQLDSTTREFENQAQSDSEKSSEILRKAIQSDTNARNLQSRLNESEAQLNHALTLLNSLEDVNEDQLSELERLLEEAERRYAEASLDKLLKEEVTRKAESDKAQLKREVDDLNKQLENLRGIYEALPSSCYNRVSLEQEGQK